MKLENCQIIADSVSYQTYSAQTVKRGDPTFVMSRSELMEFAECPEKWVGGTPENKQTPATTWGNLVECLETVPQNFDMLFAVHPDTYPPNGKPWTRKADYCWEWEEERTKDGLTVISHNVLEIACAAVKAAQSYVPRRELIECSRKQVWVKALFVGTLKIPVQCLLDLVPPADHPTFGHWLADTKSARNGNPKNFDRVIDDEGYDIQAALGLDMYVAATKEDRTDWVFPLQENKEPFHVVKPMPALTAEFLAWGRAKYQAALQYYARCLTTNEWPSYAVNGLVMGHLQLLSPEGLWTYRQTGSAGRQEDYRPEPKPERESEEITP